MEKESVGICEEAIKKKTKKKKRFVEDGGTVGEQFVQGAIV